MDTELRIRAFFSEYENRFNRALSDPPEVDVEGMAGSFASCFVGASPAGVICGKNDDQFRTVIPQGSAFYRSIGTRQMEISSIKITRLDEFHAMAEILWDSRYRKDGQEIVIGFTVFYFVQMTGNDPKIFAYVSGDERKILKENGLI